MLGESDTGDTMLKNKRSFVGQSMRKRVKVVIAGVVMNFFLAWLLLSIGFMAGMKPLLTADDFLPAVNSGIVKMEGGLRVSAVLDGSYADDLGFEVGDLLYEIDGDEASVENLDESMKNPVGSYRVVRDEEIFTFELPDQIVVPKNTEDLLGLEFENFVPCVRISRSSP